MSFGVLVSTAFFFLGAIFASFTTVIAERIYTGQSWLKGRSRCNSCRRVLSVPDLVPVFSWLFSRGRCRTCKAKVPGLYVLFEVSLGVLFVFSYLTLGLTLNLVVFLAVLIVLGFIVVYDLRHTIVPRGSSTLLIVLCLLFAFLSLKSMSAFLWIVGIALIIGFAFFLLYVLSRGRAMGLGDAPVALALALLVGSAAIPGLLFSFWIGAVIGIVVLVLQHGGPRMGIEVPFVPFLAAGFLLAFFTQWNPLFLSLPF
ncbi:prepilin peptidase [Patescibacteria group bacterium]|nr:prepilin peptidase [Patescibacteria group bacterium]